jgi:hypothetical protein
MSVKLQEHKGKFHVNIECELVSMLNWKKGDKIIMYLDKTKKILSFEKVSP